MMGYRNQSENNPGNQTWILIYEYDTRGYQRTWGNGIINYFITSSGHLICERTSHLMKHYPPKCYSYYKIIVYQICNLWISYLTVTNKFTNNLS